MGKKLSGIIVGTGIAGTRLHFGALTANGADIVAFVDMNLENAKKTAERFGVKHAYASLEEALAAHTPDFVSICTSLKSHASLARLAIARKIPVLIEKPMTETAEEALALKALSEKEGSSVVVVHNNKFCPGLRKAKDLIARGALGDILHVHREMSIVHENPGPMMEPGHWTQSIPGGFLFEGNPHSLYILYDLVGPFSLSTIEGRKVSTRWPHAKIDEFLATGTIPTGTVSIKMSLNATKEGDPYGGRSSFQFLVVVGAKGTLFVTAQNAKLLSEAMVDSRILRSVPGVIVNLLKRKFAPSPKLYDRDGKPVNLSEGSGHFAFMREYLDFLRGVRSEPPTSWEEALFVEEMNERMGHAIDEQLAKKR